MRPDNLCIVTFLLYKYSVQTFLLYTAINRKINRNRWTEQGAINRRRSATLTLLRRQFCCLANDSMLHRYSPGVSISASTCISDRCIANTALKISMPDHHVESAKPHRSVQPICPDNLVHFYFYCRVLATGGCNMPLIMCK